MNLSGLKVNPESLRRLATKFNPGVITGALTESAIYIEALEKKVEELRKTLQWYGDEVIWVTTETDGVYAIEPIEYVGDGPWTKAQQALKGETK